MRPVSFWRRLTGTKSRGDAVTEHRVARSEEVPEGSGIAVDAGDRRVAVFRHQGELFAIDETCPHRGGPLHEGPVEEGVVTCPWHQWRFELKTGASPVNPLSRVGTYPVREEDGEIFVAVGAATDG